MGWNKSNRVREASEENLTLQISSALRSPECGVSECERRLLSFKERRADAQKYGRREPKYAHWYPCPVTLVASIWGPPASQVRLPWQLYGRLCRWHACPSLYSQDCQWRKRSIHPMDRPQIIIRMRISERNITIISWGSRCRKLPDQLDRIINGEG